MIKSPCYEAWRHHRLPTVGRLRREIAPGDPVAVARAGRGRRRRPVLPQHREPRPGARPVPRDPIRRGPRQSPPADRRRPGGRPCGAVEGSAVHMVSTRPRLLPVLLPERVRGGSRRHGDRRRTAGGGDRRELRPGPRRGQQPAQPGDRGPRLLRRPERRGRPRNRVREGIALPGGPPRRETFPGPRGHVRRLPQGTARRPGGKADAPSPRTAPLPPRRARGNSRAHDRARDVPGARPRPAGHPVPEDPSQPVAGTVAVSRSGHLRRAGDEGDHGSFRHRGGGGPRRDGRVRRRARVPGGEGAGGGDRPAGPGDPGPAYVPAGGGDGGGSVGAASGVGVVERTLSAGPAGGGGGTASTAFFPPAGGLGKYRANISGR
jgi:translation initiation factor IF-2